MPSSAGAFGYVGGSVVITAGYALFQAANNTAAMVEIKPEQRGVASGVLSLARNLGLVTGASAMAAVFALASGVSDRRRRRRRLSPEGSRMTFLVAASINMAALAVATWNAETWPRRQG